VKANDCLRRIRYILDLTDKEVIALFAAADKYVTRTQVVDWLKKDDEPGYRECSDVEFATFLNGLINQRRGKKDGRQPKPERNMNNNIVLRKLKIAFNLQAEEILSILSLAGLEVSKHELSAFFRRPDHQHYRVCKDQILRNFLTGLQIKHRGASKGQDDDEVLP
jgi:uncharacterized protein YehS (DUF1456 family)